MCSCPLVFQNLSISLAHWGLCSFYPLFQSGNVIPVFVPASISIARLFIFVSDILSIIAHLLSFLQFKVAFDALLARAPALEQISSTHESQKAALMFEIRHMVTELVRLSTLDPSLSEKRRFVADLDAGLEHSILGGQLDTAAVGLHGKLLSSSEEGQQVDQELSNVSKAPSRQCCTLGRTPHAAVDASSTFWRSRSWPFHVSHNTRVDQSRGPGPIRAVAGPRRWSRYRYS